MTPTDQARQCAEELITAIGLNEVLRDEYEEIIDKHMTALMAELRADIKRIALEIAADYPNIEMVPPHEQLYAIGESVKGVTLANEDCHALIAKLRGLVDEKAFTDAINEMSDAMKGNQ